MNRSLGCSGSGTTDRRPSIGIVISLGVTLTQVLGGQLPLAVHGSAGGGATATSARPAPWLSAVLEPSLSAIPTLASFGRVPASVLPWVHPWNATMRKSAPRLRLMSSWLLGCRIREYPFE